MEGSPWLFMSSGKKAYVNWRDLVTVVFVRLDAC